MRKISLLLALLLTLTLFSSCSRKANAEIKCVSYTDDDFHFVLSYPSSFSRPAKEELDEDGDEVLYTLSANDERITLSCLLNTEQTFYDYIEKKGFEKDKMTFRSPSTFELDRRGDKEPSYLIVAATKRMIYTVEYKYTSGEREDFEKNCDMLDLEFSLYANVPKDNASLSPDIMLCGGLFSLRVAANCNYTLTPTLDPIPYKTVEVETEEDGKTVKKDISVVDTEKYSGILAYNDGYMISARAYTASDAPASAEAVKSGGHKASTERINEMLDGKVTTLTLTNEGECRQNNGKTYIITDFVCKYGKAESCGSYLIGYAENGACFEYAYLICQRTGEGESTEYHDMIASASFPKK